MCYWFVNKIPAWRLPPSGGGAGLVTGGGHAVGLDQVGPDDRENAIGLHDGNVGPVGLAVRANESD